MMQDLLKALPDDRPVTRICIVEDQLNCPPGFSVVHRTFDQDIDADLWKDSFWGKRITRYICLSKEDQASDDVVEVIGVIGERDPLPSGYQLISNTNDTDQKAMRKKQLFFKAVSRNEAMQAVTDVIVLSKNKKPPPDFSLAGEVNSLLICYKAVSLSPQKRPQEAATVSVPYSLPVVNGHATAHTAVNSGIDGVPFDIHPKLKVLFRLTEISVPTFSIKTADDILSQYAYDFSLEYQAQQAGSE